MLPSTQRVTGPPSVARSFILCLVSLYRISPLGIAKELDPSCLRITLLPLPWYGGVRMLGIPFLSHTLCALLSKGLLQLSHPLKGQKGLPQVGVPLALLLI